MLTVKDIAQAFINSQHGWAVAEQFESIYDDLSEENLMKQNPNALRYIKDCLTELVRSKVFNEDSSDELVEIATELVQHSQWNS